MSGANEAFLAAKYERLTNFSAGPSMMPIEVLQQAHNNLLNCNNSGMSVMEMSHRGKEFKLIFDQCLADLRELLQLPSKSQHQILFSQGGATLQFSAVPLNLLSGQLKGRADYAVSGQWSIKAAQEARKYANVNEVFNSETDKFRCIPAETFWNLSPDAKYFHYCSNETVNGVEFHTTPFPNYDQFSAASGENIVPLVSDMSSNFMSRPISRLEDHAVIYAGVQKNLGPAGATVLIVRDDVFGKAFDWCPVLLDYKTLKDSNSLYNTPPVWSIYVTGLVAKYLKQQGGLQHWADNSLLKSNALYSQIDNSDGFYVNRIAKECRSRMNVPFQIYEGDEALEKKFLSEASERHGLVGLAGHRMVGGCRASLYNGLPLEGVESLVNFMKDFEQENRI